MTDRVIQCPGCNGKPRKICAQGWERCSCCVCRTCNDEGTIADRRKPTPNDRAVERIKAELNRHLPIINSDDFSEGQMVLSSVLMDIINEEASRG